MKALLQRVSSASVEVEGELVGAIEQGLLVFLGVEKDDGRAQADRLLERILAYRVFADEQGKMNRSVSDIAGEVLLVSQFTLAADTHKGLRPGFSSAAAPELARELYDYMLQRLAQTPLRSASGRFAADMQISLVNDGPVTFLLECR